MTTNHSKQEQGAIQQQIRPDMNNDFSFKWLIILLALLGACILALYFMNFSGSWGNQADFGAFGDYVGGVLNPVLGFATVSLLVWSLKMQRDELSLSRQELALTRQELKETKEETSLSRQALEAQVNHIQYEAKLSELTRLLERSQTKYESLLHVSFPESHVVPEQGSFNLDNTYASFLKSLCESYDTQIAKAIAEEVTKNAQVSLHLIKLRKEAILFSDLALAYYSNSQSPEFARAYLSDALLYLMDINRLKVGESIQNRIEKIDLILDGIIQDEAQLL